MLEKHIVQKMSELIRERGGLFYKFNSTNHPGVPDRIVINRTGTVWFVEIKSENGELSLIQVFRIRELKAHGAKVRVVYGWDSAKAFIDEVLPDEL